MQYFVTVTTKPDNRTTVTREADGGMELLALLEAEFGESAQFEWSDPTSGRSSGNIEADIKRDILDSMDLPDGAYLAMADEMGLGVP